ncbi:MAG: nuclear transport factor 2 family protein [Bacteroidota bacterium]
MPKIFTFFLLGLFTPLASQAAPPADSLLVEEAAVIKVIQQLFDGMRASDSSSVRAVFESGATLTSIFVNPKGEPQRRPGGIDAFVTSIGTPHDEVYDEKIWSYDVQIDGRMAVAWTEYTFYLGEKMSHCGVNAFTLFKGTEGWKITDINDTRTRRNCRTEPIDSKPQIDSLMNRWHRAAAVADEETFFGSMTPDAIYLGTDDTERWQRDEMRKWSTKYFERESAWAFTPHSRQVYLYKDGQMAWFEEKLQTWMGPCRGSGVVQRVGKKWKIVHYNLAVTVPNDKVKAFIELIEKP